MKFFLAQVFNLSRHEWVHELVNRETYFKFMLNVFRQVLVMSYISIDAAILIYAEWLSNAEIIDTVSGQRTKN